MARLALLFSAQELLRGHLLGIISRESLEVLIAAARMGTLAYPPQLQIMAHSPLELATPKHCPQTPVLITASNTKDKSDEYYKVTSYSNCCCYMFCYCFLCFRVINPKDDFRDVNHRQFFVS
jgi:hypothetical protein